MNNRDKSKYTHEEKDGDRLRRTISLEAIPIELVSAFAGDREMDETEGARIQTLKDKRGNVFFSDLIYAISHHYFAPEIAQGIWNTILSHKYTMSGKLGRNVRIAVVTLDYLSNITSEFHSFTLISEPYITEIVSLSMRDGLTGLFNHSTCYELLELELRKFRGQGAGVALIMMDIDDFKSVNDKYGHHEGNRILLDLATTLSKQTRDSDICCRIGGDEFAVILPFTNDPQEAFWIAERIRIGAMELTCNGQKISVSAGVSLCDDSIQTFYTLLERADRALYQAKRTGKNKVIVDGGFKPSGFDPS